jgi:DNA processing protein
MHQIQEIPIPPQLNEIPDPPERLYCIGTPPQPEEILLVVVGSRKYTSYGKAACEKLILGLSGYPITIVSGLAIGIDTIAHQSALLAQLRTIAVPGSGLSEQVLYPRTNIPLAKEIVKQGGALLSEFEPSFRATEWSFPKRNRIMAGLSQAVLIIEATEKSGTLITSRLATEYNRDVFAVPGSIFSDNSLGPNMLITLGATPIRNSTDILFALGFTPESDASQPPTRSYEMLPEREQQVMSVLIEPMSKDMLGELLHVSANELNVLLMKLEIAGLVKDDSGYISRT